jgi:hypothetical protein
MGGDLSIVQALREAFKNFGFPHGQRVEVHRWAGSAAEQERTNFAGEFGPRRFVLCQDMIAAGQGNQARTSPGRLCGELRGG